MPEQYRLFDNPAYGNVKSQTVDINVPSEGEYFINKAGGQNQLYQRRGNELVGLGYTPPAFTGGPGGERDWQGRTIGSFQNEATSSAISKLGLGELMEFRSPDMSGWMKGAGITKRTIQDFNEFSSGAVNPTSQFNQNITYGESNKPRIEIPQGGKWIDPTTGQPTAAGVGIPESTSRTNQQSSGLGTHILNEADLESKRQVLRGAGVKEADFKNFISLPGEDPNNPDKLFFREPITLNGPNGQTKTVPAGSVEANGLLANNWTTGQQVGSDVTSGMLAGQSEINLPSGLSGIGGSNASQLSAGAASTSKSVDEAIKRYQDLLTAPETADSRELDNLRGLLGESIEGLEGRGAAQLSEEERRGIEEKTNQLASQNTQLKAKLAEIQALESSFQLENQREEGRPQTLSSLRGQQAQNYKMYIAQKNLLTSEAGYIQAEMLGLQGEVQAAQNAANRAVGLEYADRESRYNSLLAQSQLLEKQVEGDEAKYTSAVSMYLQDQQDALAEEKDMKKSILDVKMQAISAGITDPNILNQISNAGSVDRALQVLGTNMPQGASGDFQFISGTDNQQQGTFDRNTGIFTPSGGTPSGQTTGAGGAGVVTDASGSSYDIGSYATDPNHEASVQSILGRIGQMTSYEQMDSYIQSVAPNSPITGEMIGNAAEKHGVSWETMMAIMQQDSSFATAGKAVRTFNPGNVGNVDSGAEVNYGDWQSGVDAVAKNLAWRSVSGNTGTFPDDIEFKFNEKIDVSRLPDLGGKQITNKTARQGNLPFSVTDKQADFIIEHRAGNVQFQQLASKDFEKLADLFEVRDDINEIRKLKEDVNTGPIASRAKRTSGFFGFEDKSFNQLEVKSGKQLAEFIKEISGAAVSEDEAQRLARLVPNVGMQDNRFTVSLNDLEDDLNNLISAKINQFDLFDEEELRNAVFGGQLVNPSISNTGQSAEDILKEYNIQ